MCWHYFGTFHDFKHYIWFNSHEIFIYALVTGNLFEFHSRAYILHRFLNSMLPYLRRDFVLWSMFMIVIVQNCNWTEAYVSYFIMADCGLLTHYPIGLQRLSALQVYVVILRNCCIWFEFFFPLPFHKLKCFLLKRNEAQRIKSE